MKLFLSIIVSTLLTTNAFALDSMKIAGQLVDVLEDSINQEYILGYQDPVYVDSYENTDGTQIHLFTVVIAFPLYNGSNGFDLGGNTETTEPPTGSEVRCEYIKYDPVAHDYTYGGPCFMSLEMVTDGALFDEKLIDEL